VLILGKKKKKKPEIIRIFVIASDFSYFFINSTDRISIPRTFELLTARSVLILAALCHISRMRYEAECKTCS